MNLSRPKELNRLPHAEAEKELLAHSYARMPNQQDEVWGREEGESLHLIAYGPEGWHEPQELLFPVQNAAAGGGAPVRLSNGDDVTRSQEVIEGREVFKPQDPRSSARYLRICAVLTDDKGKQKGGQERYFLIRH